MSYARRILLLTALLAVVPAPASAGPAPVLHVTLKARGIPAGTPLRDGRTFDVPYGTLILATATLTDAATGAPLAGVPVRVTGELFAPRPAPATNAGGSAELRLKPLITGDYIFDVPSSAGTLAQHVTFQVAPGWKIAPAFAVRHGKLVVSGRLLAAPSVASEGSYVKLQRRIQRRWVTVRRLTLTRSRLVTARLSRSAYAGSRMRFVYVSRTADYIDSSRTFTVKAAKPATPPANGGGDANLGGAGSGGLAGGSGGTCVGC
jgi:hypothetical protein